MANTSYIKILQTLESFSSAHMQIKRFGSDFPEQMPNFATTNEEYPILFVSPSTSIFDANTNLFTLTIYCWDIIQKDRTNINTILSDTNLILNDLYRWYKDGDIYGIDIITTPTITPINNALLDYAAGWQMTLTFEVDTYGVCEIPFGTPPVVVTEVNDVVYGTYLTCETLPTCQTIIDINDTLAEITAVTPSQQSRFDTTDPNLPGTIFDPVLILDTDTLYVSDINDSLWTSDGIAYQTYIPPTIASTSFQLYGTSIDAGGNKTAFIQRQGPILINSSPSNGTRYAAYIYSRTSSGQGNGLLVRKDLRTTSGNYLLVQGWNSGTGELQDKLRVNHDGSLLINDAYTLPNVGGTAGQVLTNDGTGNVSWNSISIPTQYWGPGAGLNSVLQLGNNNTANGNYSIATGKDNQSNGQYTHTEGWNNKAQNNYAHAEGTNTQAIGSGSHAEGGYTIASGAFSHAEGANTQATGSYSHAEGRYAISTGSYSHAEGRSTISLGLYSHAGGYNSDANGESSFVHGNASFANGNGTSVLGNGLTGTKDNTTYVNELNINTLPVGTSVFNLGIDASGYVIQAPIPAPATFDREQDWQDPYLYLGYAPTGTLITALDWTITRSEVALDGTTTDIVLTSVAWTDRAILPW